MRSLCSARLASVLVCALALAGCAEGVTGGQRDAGDDGVIDACAGSSSDCTPDMVADWLECVPDETRNCFSGDEALVGQGRCANGTQTCDAQGTWGDCEGEVLPSDEVCDGEDNDCDGETDEEQGTETCGEGVCEVTVELCQDGQPVTCTPGAASSAEACDGVDDDCDGTVDEECDCIDDEVQDCYSGSLDTRNQGQCSDGVQTCQQGAWSSCVDETTPTEEVCNGLDDNCDGFVDEDDAEGGAVCDTDLDGICAVGTEHCVEGKLVCVQDEQPGEETCDGLDNDCNPATPDGSADAAVGVACDGSDADLCTDGTTICSAGSLVCDDDPSSVADTCDGVDNDCNPATADGSDDAAVGQSCDGTDTDLCADGTTICSAGSVVCDDDANATTDTCDGLDNDCNPATADGSDDAAVGQSCDGTDTDLCADGTTICSAGSVVCDDDANAIADICDGLDNDCNPATPDGAGDAAVGLSCDGTDTDLCADGTTICSAGSVMCNDDANAIADICDGLDNDCNPATADGANEAIVGDACDGTDTDQCVEGVYECTGGTIFCSDTTDSTFETCNGVDDDCNGSVDEGYNRDDNPSCSTGSLHLGSVDGDTGAGTLSDSWYNEEWDRFTVLEANTSTVYLSATISLYSPPNTDFDLYVYCDSCAGGLAGSSTVHSGAGHWDIVDIRRDDTGVSDSFDVVVEVRHYSSSVCAYWDLDVQGNTIVSTATCN